MHRNVWCLLWLSVGLIGPVAWGDALTPLELQWLGRKFVQWPVEKRLAQLEQISGQASAWRASTALRLARVQAATQGKGHWERRQRAVRAYNEGVSQAQQGQVDAAIHAYREALAADPTLIEARNNLAHLLAEQDRLAEAVAVYQEAIRLAPDQALLYRNLGVLQERQGDMAGALQAYEAYLERSEKPDPAIQSVVDQLKAHQQLGDDGPDYLAVTTASSDGRRLTWPRALRPVPVYVAWGDPHEAWLMPVVRDAFRAWEQASGGKLRFREVGDPRSARIHMQLDPGPLADAYEHVGHAQFDAEDPARPWPTYRVSIRLNTGTGSETADPNRRLTAVRKLVLHELGHAIGIWGHSLNPRDVMYTHPLVSELSARDARTVKRLYDGD